MAKSNITLSPQKKTVLTDHKNTVNDISENKISAIINKGGSPTKESEVNQDVFKNFNIKILENELQSINQLRQKRPKPRGQKRLGISLHQWLIEAIKEKIERENDEYNT